jgi:hypothetical protein
MLHAGDARYGVFAGDAWSSAPPPEGDSDIVNQTRSG